MTIYQTTSSGIAKPFLGDSIHPVGTITHSVDMTGLNSNTWYPVTCQVVSYSTPTHLTVCRGYSDTGYDLGSVNLQVLLHGSSWGGNTMLITTLVAAESYRRMCLGWGWSGHGGTFTVVLRGGFVYNFTINKPLNQVWYSSGASSSYGPVVITSQVKYYETSPDMYDQTMGPVTSATDSSVTNQNGYWDGTAITSPITSIRDFAIPGGFNG